MKRLITILISLLLGNSLLCQETSLQMTTSYDLDNTDMMNILRFQGINFQKLTFSGKELKNKAYKIAAKEYLDGKLVTDSVITNSNKMPYPSLQKINDTVFPITVVTKQLDKTTLKIEFQFSRYTVPKELRTIDVKDKYSLRNVAAESKLPIGYDKKFYLLAYILPYERKDGSGIKSYCDVGSSGGDIENWGTRFGIKHYWVFEMEFM